MSERSVVFGRSGDVYDRARPDYPQVAVDHVLGLTDVVSAVEVGSGTGIATARFARPGLEMICIEPDAGMAALLTRRRLPGVKVVVSTFEDWPAPGGTFGLLLAAQSWHWIDTEIGYPKAHDLLRPGGVIALMWNVQIDRFGEFEAVYRRHAPELLAEADIRIVRRDSDVWLDELRTAGFDDVGVFTHQWSATRRPEELSALYSTFSDHIVLDDESRQALLAALETHVEELGGSVRLDYRTQVFTGRASLTSGA